MNRRQYYAARQALRVAMRADSKAFKTFQDNAAYGLARGASFDHSHYANQVLADLAPRDREAVLSTPLLAQFVPMGPRAREIYFRTGMDLNKRVALRRALKAYELAFPRQVQVAA